MARPAREGSGIPPLPPDRLKPGRHSGSREPSPEALLHFCAPAQIHIIIPAPQPLPQRQVQSLCLPLATHQTISTWWPWPCPRKLAVPPQWPGLSPVGPQQPHRAAGAGTQHSRYAVAFGGTGHRRTACRSSGSTSPMAPVPGLGERLACGRETEGLQSLVEGLVRQDDTGVGPTWSRSCPAPWPWSIDRHYLDLVGLLELCVQQSPRGAPRGFGAVSQGLSLQKGGAECPWEAVTDGLGNHGGSCDCQR